MQVDSTVFIENRNKLDFHLKREFRLIFKFHLFVNKTAKRKLGKSCYSELHVCSYGLGQADK